MHQPATNQELHFKVEAASQMAAGVFPVKPITNTTYTYDAAGQMTGESGTGVSPVSFAYDAARNMKQCVFDGGNRTNFYYYDHARRLVKEEHTCTGVVEESSTFVYEGMDVIAKLDETTGEMVYFTRGLGIAPGVGDVLAETHILGSLTQTYIYVQNHRGDTIALVGTNGAVVARYEYTAWGQISDQQSTISNMTAWLTFSGKHYDADAGLYYYGFRWYDSQAKRWTQPDPSGLAEGLDLYQFCGNDPVVNVDIDGRVWYNPIDRDFVLWEAGSWGARQAASGAEYSRRAAVATYDYTFDDRCLFVGWLTGSMGEMLSGTRNLVAGCPAQGVSQWRTGFNNLLLNPLYDVAGLVYGMGYGKPYTLQTIGGDMLDAMYQQNAAQFRRSSFDLTLWTLIPNDGTHGGPGWGIDQERRIGGAYVPYEWAFVFPQDRIGYASRLHDLRSQDGVPESYLGGRMGQAHREWIVNAWTSPAREPGPCGQAYRLIGTPAFLLISAIDWR